MPKQPDITPEDFPHIGNAFAIIGQINEDDIPYAFKGFRGITRDEQTGRIAVDRTEGEELLTSAEILDALKAMPSFLAESNDAVRENIELVCALGMKAMEGLSDQAGRKTYSKTALLGLQRALKSIGQKTAIAFIYTDMPRKETAAGLASLNEIVNPDPRLARYRQQRKAADERD